MDQGYPASAPQSSAAPSSEQPKEQSSPTALLPLNAFGGKTPAVGETVSFKITSIYEDQVEVEYAGAEESDATETEMQAMPPESPDSMSGLMQ